MQCYTTLQGHHWNMFIQFTLHVHVHACTCTCMYTHTCAFIHVQSTLHVLTYSYIIQVDNFVALKDLRHLHTLNVAHCQSASGAMATLEGCSRLHTLSLAGVAVDTSSLQRLASKSWLSIFWNVAKCMCTCMYNVHVDGMDGHINRKNFVGGRGVCTIVTYRKIKRAGGLKF